MIMISLFRYKEMRLSVSTYGQILSHPDDGGNTGRDRVTRIA